MRVSERSQRAHDIALESEKINVQARQGVYKTGWLDAWAPMVAKDGLQITLQDTAAKSDEQLDV